jgi:hypothetical protein
MDGDFSGFAESSHSDGLLKHRDTPTDSDWGGPPCAGCAPTVQHWSTFAANANPKDLSDD